MLVEAIVASSIIAASFLTIISVSTKAIYVSREALQNTQASFLLEEGAEAVRVRRDNAWANISSLNNATTYYPTFTGGTWTLSNTPSQVGIFTRTVNIASVNRDNSTADIAAAGADDPSTKLITVTVTWVYQGTTMSKTLSFYIMNILT